MAASWRFVLPILSALIALAHAGGKTLSPQESAQFLQMFRRYCASPASGPTQEGNTFFYCKTSDGGPITQNLNHDTEIASGDTPKQVIFVQPPSYQYIHNVALRGSPGNPQQTDIYVLPATAEHNVQLQDTRTAVQGQKPSLYFLSDQQQQQGSGSSGGNVGLPSPVAGTSGSVGFSTGQRPSAPPPRPSNPNVIGIEGYPQQQQPQQPQPLPQQTQQQQGYSQAYGAPAPAFSPRSQRNLRGSHYSSNSNTQSRYSSLI